MRGIVLNDEKILNRILDDINFNDLLLEFIRESNAIDCVFSNREIDNAFDAYNFLLNKDSLTVKNILEAHALTMKDLIPKEHLGKFREEDISFGGLKRMKPMFIEDSIRTMVRYNPCDGLNILKWHVEFEMVYPFEDGSGRIGRMLYFWHCNKANIKPFIFRESEKQSYYGLFS